MKPYLHLRDSDGTITVIKVADISALQTYTAIVGTEIYLHGGSTIYTESVINEVLAAIDPQIESRT